MSERTLVGGPLDGQEREVYGGLKVPMGLEYRWTFACGKQSYAYGHYAPDGVWSEPEYDKLLPYVCLDCKTGEED